MFLFKFCMIEHAQESRKVSIRPIDFLSSGSLDHNYQHLPIE